MAPIAVIAVVVLASILSGYPGLIALVPVLVFLIVRRLAEHQLQPGAEGWSRGPRRETRARRLLR